MSRGPVYASALLPTPIIPNDNKPLLVVFEAAAAGLWQNAAESAAAITITDQASMQAAEKSLLMLHDAEKAIEARRVELKKPITAFGKAIEEVVAQVSEPVSAAKRSLQGKIAMYVRAERAKAEEAQRLADEEARKAREAAEVERKRLQAEADAKHAAEVAKAAADAKELADMLGESAPAPEPVAVAPAPVVSVPEPARAPTVVMPKSEAIQMRKVQRVVVDDPSLIPRTIGTEVLMVPDMVAIKHVMMLGIPVAGCHVETTEEPVMARRA